MSFLFGGLLNSPLRRISEYVRGAHIPFTEFIRASRVALIAGYPGSFWCYLGLSFVGGLVFLVLGLAAYSAAENRARRLGVVDRKAV